LLDNLFHGSLLKGLQDDIQATNGSLGRLLNQLISDIGIARTIRGNLWKNLATELGFLHMDDWYNITAQNISDFGRVGLVNKYSSPHQGHWNKVDNQR
jgi:hypothetical protein